jgi:exosortase/archaeosortase family protein
VTQVLGIPAAGTGPNWGSLRVQRDRWRLRWSGAQPRTRTTIQLTVLFGAIIIGYSYSLVTLLQNAEMQTPLAYISLVPAISLALAVAFARPERTEPAIHDRQLDYIVGVPLIATAMAMNMLLPNKLSAMFWVWRIDLLSLPIFIAGLVAVLFGVRVLWRQKFAIGYLLLAWPWPYSTVLLRVLDASTTSTLAGLRVVLRVIPVAKPAPSGDGSLFDVIHHGGAFPISVVSACSGINGIVGFLLIGVAFVGVVRGPWIRKVAWLVVGMLFLWLINLGRLVLIFWAGKMWGESIAINILHPFVGLVTFTIGVVIMSLAIRPMGMTIGRSGPEALGKSDGEVSGKARGRGIPAVPKVFAAVALVAVATMVLGVADFGLRSYNLVANAAGEPKLLAFRASPTAPEGWRYRISNQYDWAKPLFGDDSTWLRYVFVPSGGGGSLRSSYGVTADIIDTSDLQTFSAYGVEDCYQFHGYTLRDVAQVDIGGGITGQTLSFSGAGQQSWSVVYWIAPVRAGRGIRYERFVLYLLNAPGGAGVHVPRDVHITNLAGSLGKTGSDAILVQNRAFLVAFAHELVVNQSLKASVDGGHLAMKPNATSPKPAASGNAGVPDTPTVRSSTSASRA